MPEPTIARVPIRRALAACLGLLLAALTAGPAAAADGDLRDSFSGDGRVITDFGPAGEDQPGGAAVDAAGRLVVAGTSILPPQGARLAVARYLPNGSLDPSFGVGLVVGDLEGGMVAADGVVDAAGRIVLAGPARRVGSNPHDFAI